MNQVRYPHCGKPLHGGDPPNGGSGMCPECGEVFHIKGRFANRASAGYWLPVGVDRGAGFGAAREVGGFGL